jgi:heavy metal sensor kinase
MRSIRWSLVVYFLVLVAVALGGVSWFGYQSVQSALEAKEASTRVLLTAQHEENKKRTHDEFDKRLDKQAHEQELASYAVFHVHQVEPLYVFGAIGCDPLMLPGWLFESLVPTQDIRRARPIDIRFHGEFEDDVPVLEAGQYYQAFRFRGQPLQHSDNLRTPERELSAEIRRKVDQNQVHFDWFEVQPGTKIRRVTFRASVRNMTEGLIVPSLRSFGPKLKIEPPKLAKGPRGPFFPITIYIQYASEPLDQEREDAVAKLQTDLTRDLAVLKDDTDSALAELRKRMMWVGLTTFAALVVGGFWLIRVGLMPLDRLSDAVSRVSERDFRLRLDDKPLPTELRPIAERLRQTLEQLQRAFAREKQAAADISHELRTPLAALLTTLDVGLRKERTVEEYRELLEYSRASGQQMTQLVERLLSLARLDAGVDTLRPREVDVAALADQCAALVRPLAEARGLRLNVHKDGPACISGDPEKLREVLTNLLHNAIEYNRPDGVIEVAVARNNGNLQMEVRDTGIGISPEAKLHIFERFYRSDPSRHAEGLHAGLGLSIVKGYIDLMGGSIDVDSTVGQGSTFRVRLPLQPVMMRV